jgi:hypothetical protein
VQLLVEVLASEVGFESEIHTDLEPQDADLAVVFPVVHRQPYCASQILFESLGSWLEHLGTLIVFLSLTALLLALGRAMGCALAAVHVRIPEVAMGVICQAKGGGFLSVRPHQHHASKLSQQFGPFHSVGHAGSQIDGLIRSTSVEAPVLVEQLQDVPAR